MTADTAAVLLVLSAAPFATASALIFSWKARRTWWRHILGCALMASLWGLALLIDISLLYNWLGDDYALRDVVRLTVYSLILGGSVLTCVSMVWAYFFAKDAPGE